MLLYPMLILSGAGWTRELMPATVREVLAYVPLSYVVNLLRGHGAAQPGAATCRMPACWPACACWA